MLGIVKKQLFLPLKSDGILLSNKNWSVGIDLDIGVILNILNYIWRYSLPGFAWFSAFVYELPYNLFWTKSGNPDSYGNFCLFLSLSLRTQRIKRVYQGFLSLQEPVGLSLDPEF